MLLVMSSEYMPSHVPSPNLYDSTYIQADKLLGADFNMVLP